MNIAKVYNDYLEMLNSGISKDQAVKNAAEFWDHVGITEKMLTDYIKIWES